MNRYGLCALAGFERRDPATLSGGEKQRLATAAVLAMRPPILVFDEPTTDLDPVGKRDVFRVLESMRHEGHTMLLSAASAASISCSIKSRG